jgi:hypothetical protein
LKEQAVRSDVFDQVLLNLRILFAAALGAAFYSLYTANSYIIKRTFDRAFTTHYVVRFVLGVVSGCLLAHFNKLFIGVRLDNTALGSLALPALALLGGYSAEAVYALLTRVVDTMTTLVKGSGKEQARADGDTAVAKAQATVDTDRLSWKKKELERLNRLLAAATAANALSVAQDIRKEIDDLT